MVGWINFCISLNEKMKDQFNKQKLEKERIKSIVGPTGPGNPGPKSH